MKASKKCIDLIKHFEGCKLTGYLCPASVPTVGYGHTGTIDGKPVTVGMKITQEKAEELLSEVLNNKYGKAVDKLGLDLTQEQYDALVSFCYNLGTGIFKGDLLEALKKNDWEDVARQMKLYNKARVNGVLQELKGLTRRRLAEAELFLKGSEEEVKVETIKINVNGVMKEASAVVVDGNNYIKLRDIGDSKITISYDAENKVPVVTSK